MPFEQTYRTICWTTSIARQKGRVGRDSSPPCGGVGGTGESNLVVELLLLVRDRLARIAQGSPEHVCSFSFLGRYVGKCQPSTRPGWGVGKEGVRVHLQCSDRAWGPDVNPVEIYHHNSPHMAASQNQVEAIDWCACRCWNQRLHNVLHRRYASSSILVLLSHDAGTNPIDYEASHGMSHGKNLLRWILQITVARPNTANQAASYARRLVGGIRDGRPPAARRGRLGHHWWWRTDSEGLNRHGVRWRRKHTWSRISSEWVDCWQTLRPTGRSVTGVIWSCTVLTSTERRGRGKAARTPAWFRVGRKRPNRAALARAQGSGGEGTESGQSSVLG